MDIFQNFPWQFWQPTIFLFRFFPQYIGKLTIVSLLLSIPCHVWKIRHCYMLQCFFPDLKITRSTTRDIIFGTKMCFCVRRWFVDVQCCIVHKCFMFGDETSCHDTIPRGIRLAWTRYNFKGRDQGLAWMYFAIDLSSRHWFWWGWHVIHSTTRCTSCWRPSTFATPMKPWLASTNGYWWFPAFGFFWLFLC